MLARFFIDRPVFAWVIALAIILVGMLALRNLPVASYPSVAPPALAISVTYPGASSRVMEETVIALVEQELNGVEHLAYFDSSSEQGTGTINLSFEAGTDLDVAMMETQNRVKRVEARLPDEVRRIGVQVYKSARNHLLISVLFSPDKTHDNVALGSFAATHVLDSIRRVPGVGEAMLLGTEYSMRIWLKPGQLESFGLTAGDVARAVRSQNVQLATGELGQLPSVEGQQLNAIITTHSRLTSVEEFENIIVRANRDGSTVRIKDVAKVELGAQDYSVRARYDGQPAVGIAVRTTPNANALDTARAVRAKLTELSAGFPPGSVDWAIPYDTSKFVEVSIAEVVETLIIAMVLVFVVMFLFLENLRATLIPAIVMPITLCGALAGLYLFDYSINVLTLFAMVLAIGIVVDDAIVVVENVERIMREEGLPARAATRKAMDQIVGAIIAITLVLTAVFVPMAFFSGSVGAIYRQFSVTLVLAMGFSALLALTLTPALCATMLKPHHQQPLEQQRGFFGWFNRFFDRTTRGYQSGVTRILRRTGLYMLIYVILLAAVATLFVRLPSGFLPDEDQGYYVSMIQLPTGASQERALDVLGKVEKLYLDQPEVAHVIGVAGFSFIGRSQNAGTTFVPLKPWSERKGAHQEAGALVGRVNGLLQQIKEAFIVAINVPPIPELAAAGGFDFRLQDRSGQGRDKLLEARNMMLGMAAQHPALMGVRPEGQEPGAQLEIDVDRIKAQALGVDIAQINETLQSTLGIAYINDFVRQGRILRVQMQAEARTRSNVDEIMRLTVRNQNGGLVRLAEIAAPRWVVGSSRLDRYNGLPAMKLAGMPAPGRSTGEALQAMEEIAAKLPPGFGYEWSSTSHEERVSGTQAPFLFAVSLFVVFLCLAALYESWTIPLSVLLVVPLGILGALAAVHLRGLPNDVYFKVGLIAIIGLSSKNAILIIEFARELEEQGRSLVDATLEACRLRFRPILMTSIAFIFGVLPLAISSGAGANSRHALGTGVMGGMIAATVLAVLLVPVFYVVIRRIFPGHARHHRDAAADQAQENPHA
ncbi:multidrug efflux system protein [Sterolibacterium denitrificans]|uniref:Efflux pump membrane transporter n=1 Tax=Sterolibacterium denitrificans TaxID=157592 RepID=A0A7Z7HPI8_9PROT|nr:efflux RND transporter permease subunit [Sterolibacterium denitrificans]SMB21786.1 multidrug efflux system protein [Sterolibacterium denitrificans]